MPATNPNLVLLGGSADNSAATCASHILTRSTNGGTTFVPSQVGLHADMHAIAFAPSNPDVIYIGNDGGVWRSIDAGLTWTSRNTIGFSATQFQSIALHPTHRTLSLGGTQD